MELAPTDRRNNNGGGTASPVSRASPRALAGGSQPNTSISPSNRAGVHRPSSLRPAPEGETDATYSRLEAGWDPDSARGAAPPLATTMSGRCRQYAEMWRWLDFCIFAVILIIARVVVPAHHMYIPPTKSTTATGTIIGYNPQFSYPIKLAGHVCEPSTLEQCRSVALSHPCCVALDKDANAFETVSGKQLIIITTVIPLLFIALRHWFMSKRPGGDDLSLRDILLGYFAAMTTTVSTTDVIKLVVGYPRPNNYALTLLASQTTHTKQAHNAFRSFPSGHASMSMTSMLYVTLLSLYLLRRERHKLAAPYRSLFMVLAWMPVLVALYIGMTRILNL